VDDFGGHAARYFAVYVGVATQETPTY